LTRITRREPLKLTLSEAIFPLFCSSRKDIFQKIKDYIKAKLSLDNILKESDEFDRVKRYLFNSHELYVFENMDRVNSRILNRTLEEQQFDCETFRHSYQQLTNPKFIEIIG
jgi:lysyl-tRNA synthetase class I